MTRSTHTSNHMRRLFVARKLFAVMLALCLVIIELAGSREARAEFTFSVTPGGTIAVGNFVPPPTYNKCGDAKPRLANYPNSAAGYEQYNEDTFHWDNCYQSDEEEDLGDYVDFILGRPMSMHTELPAKTPTGSARASARSSSSGTPNLGSSTPGLPFLGNSLVVISYALNAAALADATTAYKIGTTPSTRLQYRRRFDSSKCGDTQYPQCRFLFIFIGRPGLLSSVSGIDDDAGCVRQGL